MKAVKLVWIVTLLSCVDITPFYKGIERLLKDVEVVTAEELKKELDRKKVTVVNVLRERAYKDCNIRGSKNIPLSQLKQKVKSWDKSRKIIVHCASYDCPLSRYAYKQLKELGFINVKSFEGGLKEWKQKGYPVKGKCKAGYLKS